MIQYLMSQTMIEWRQANQDRDAARLERILVVAQCLNCLPVFLDPASYYDFCTELACLASSRGIITMHDWMEERTRINGVRE